MQSVVSTATLPDAERAAAWERAVRHWLAPLRVAVPQGVRSFEGTLWSSDLGYVRVLSMTAGPVRLSRTTRLVSAAPDDHVVLAVQAAGTAALHQDGRGATLRPGELALCDLRRPFSFEQRDTFRLHLLRVPAHALGLSPARARQVTGRAVPGTDGVAALLGPFVSALAAEADRAAAPVADRLAGNITDLLATLIDEQSPRQCSAADTAREHLRTVVRRYVDENLRDPDLSPAGIARAHRISVRYLHLLFQGEETTVGKLILRRRVEECARELGRRAAVALTISAVARGWGFRNVAHFSRSFKAVYGYSPRDWRDAGPHAPGAVPVAR
ncbi:AraC-like ligand-binding domain-containing protein [Streptomyces sp. NPDC001595]|uniref:AraC-like ligand-binding domain-containing protein n=1 Tax=Streptomyces sp. NPDC001532 TaxID=3154520 RepID=UPI003321A571